MMKRILFILTLVSLSCSIWAQEANSHQSSGVPENSRFQIVQSDFGVRFTFNIDKYTGNVFLLVEDSDELTWQLIDSEKQAFDEQKHEQVNYQLFSSGIGVRYTFLLNVNTGITWQLSEDLKSGNYFWAAMK